MKHSRMEGFEQDYNAQIAVDQASLLIVGETLSNHPTDQHEAEPTLDAIPPEMKKLEFLKSREVAAQYLSETGCGSTFPLPGHHTEEIVFSTFGVGAALSTANRYTMTQICSGK